MDSNKLLSYIADRINSLSKFYFAEVSQKPKLYYELIGGRLIPSLKIGICICRDITARFMPTTVFLFEPEIIRYVRKLSHSDAGFAQRLTMLELIPDDIENMVSYLSCNQLKLYMKGRTKFHIYEDD